MNDRPVGVPALAPFTGYSFHRGLIKWMGPPVSAVLVLGVIGAAIVGVLRDDLQDIGVVAVAVPVLVWVLFAVHSGLHSYVAVSELGVTILNGFTVFQNKFTRYEIPWTAVDKIELSKLRYPDGSDSWFSHLVFTTPGGVIAAVQPISRDSAGGRMAALRNHIEDYRDQALATMQKRDLEDHGHGHPEADDGQPATIVTVTGPIRRYLDQHAKFAKIATSVAAVAYFCFFAVVLATFGPLPVSG